MNDNHETSAAIIAEMRIFKCCNLETGELELCNAIANYFADRLEAAIKRELSATAEKSSAVGDSAKLRKALEKAAESAAEIMERVRHKDGLAFNTANYIAGIAKDALASPARNCDIVPIEAREAADMFHRERPCHGYCYETHDWLLAPATEKEGGAK